MSAGHPVDEGSMLFRPGFAAEAGSDNAPLWPLLRQAMVGEISVQRTWLVRWKPAAADAAAQATNDVRARSLVQAILAASPPGTVCLRYDSTSVLVLAAQADWSGPGAADGLDDDLEFWQATAVFDEGIRFRPMSADTRPEASGMTTAPAKPARSKLVLSDAEHTYFPLWDVTANQVFAYLCRAAWSGPDGQPISEGSPEIRGTAPERLAAIDLTLFRAATSFVQNALDNYGSVDVVIPVHCGIMSSQRAVSTLFDTVAREIWPVLENVYFEVIPEPAPESFRNVDAVIAQMATYGRPMLLRVDADDDLSELPTADWLSIGLEPSWWAGEDDMVPLLDQFAGWVRSLGYAGHVFGLTGTPATVGAVNAGFAYVGSDAIAPPLTGDDDAQAQPTDILKAILASRAAR